MVSSNQPPGPSGNIRYETLVGFQDGTFMINTLIHLRHNHNLPKWVAFADLVKAFGTSNHALLIAILGKYGAPPKTTLSNLTHVRQKYSEAHHWKGGDSHRIQIGCQTRRQHGPGTISILNYGLSQNTRRWVNGPRTKQIPICVQRQPTKINRTTSEPPTRHLLVWNNFYLFFMLYVEDSAFAFEFRTGIAKGVTLLFDYCSRFGLDMHIRTGKNHQRLNAYFSCTQVSLKHKQYR